MKKVRQLQLWIAKPKTWIFLGKKSIQASPRVEKSLENPITGLWMLLLCEFSLWMDLVSRTASKNNSSVTRRSAVRSKYYLTVGSCKLCWLLMHYWGKFDTFKRGWERVGDVHCAMWECGVKYAEPVYVNVYGALESIPRNRFRQPM